VTVYWIHTGISYPLAQLLRGLLPQGNDDDWRDLQEHTIEHFDEANADDEPDWFEAIARTDCVVVMCVGKRHPVFDLLKRSGLRVVTLPEAYSQMNRFDQAHLLTGAWKNIVAKTYKARSGTRFKVNGRNVDEA
jgi:hypothetical protein